MKQKYFYFLLLTFFTLITFSQNGTHLHFDGIDDRVTIPANNAFNFTTGAVEAWIYIEANSENKSVVSLRENANSSETRWSLFVNEGNNRIGIFNGTTYSSISYNLNPNTWYHVSWRMGVSFTLIFVNGVQVGMIFNTLNNVSINVPLTIGAPSSNGTNLNEYFKGSIDDVRIWNSGSSIDYNCELTGNESGLIAYYKLNQGIASGSNPSETTVYDATANGFNGTLNNFALSGSSSNWLGGSPLSSLAEPAVSSPVNYMHGESASPLTAVSGGSGLLWYTSETGGTGSSTAPTPDTTVSGLTSYWVSSTYNGGCESARSKIDVNVAYLATHLNFDGTDDYITLSNESNFDFTNQITVEFWMNSNTLPQQWDALIAKGDDSWRIALTSAGNIGFAGTNAFTDFFSTISVTDGNWHHIAATYDGVNAKIYIDGVLENQIAGSANINNSAYNVSFGENLQAQGRYYNGNMDEVRIWNVARTATQINASKNCELQGNETGLVAYYKFNQGQVPADNSGITTLIDASPNTINGVLNNFALNGSVSNWLVGSPINSGLIIPNIPIVSANIIYNIGDTPSQLSANVGANGTGLLWYTSANGGIGSTTAPTPSTAIAGNTSYWVSTTNSNGCESERVEVVVTVNAIVSPPQTLWLTQIYTGDDKTLAELQVTGTAIQWYDAATGGNLLPISTSLADDTTYFASQTIFGVESNLRLPILVNRISDNSQTINSTSTINDVVLFPSTGLGVQWFTSPTGGVALQNTDILTSGVYYVEQNSFEYVEILKDGLINPVGVGIQSDGKIIFSNTHLSNSSVQRINADGSNLETLGSGFSMPYGIAVQEDDKIIIADSFNNAIKRMNADGTNIVTIGGTFSALGVAVQSDGKIVIADSGNNAIKRMNADGSNVEILGSGFIAPSDVAIDAEGKIIIADRGNNVIKRMNADGSNIETLINVTSWGVAVQIDGKIVFSDNNSYSVKRMDADGSNVITLASGFNPRKIAIQSDGRFVVADYGNNQIKRIGSPSNRVAINLNTILNTQIYTGDDKTIANLQVVGTNIQWYDTSTGGNLLPITTNLVDDTTYYISQTINGSESQNRLPITVNRISDNSQSLVFGSIVNDLISTPTTGTDSKWYENASTSTPLLGNEILNNGTYYISQANHGFTSEILGSGFTNPSDVAIQQDGKIVIADTNSFVVKRMNADGTNIENLASFPRPLSVSIQADGKIIVSTFDYRIIRMNSDGSNPEELLSLNPTAGRSYGTAVESDGKILFTNSTDNSVKRMNSDGSNIQIIGSGFNNPAGIAVQADGSILIADKGNNAIKRMNKFGNNIETLGFGFNSPDHVKVRLDGKIIVSDSGNGAIKSMNADGSNIQVISNGYNLPKGIAIEPNGNIILAESGNNQIRRITQFNQSESNGVPVGVTINSRNATHLNFDGVNDNITLGTNICNTFSEGSAITIEYWFKGTNLESGLRLQGDNGYIVAGWGGNADPSFIISTDGGTTNGITCGSSTTIEDDSWHHLAFVWEKNNIFATYLDGVVQDSRTAGNVNLPNVANELARIGSHIGIQEFLNGNIDEVRIWNIARTTSEINASMNCELQGNETGLVAYYNFNQGLDQADNTSVTSLTDITSNGNNGVLINFALNGASSNWLADSPVITGSVVPLTPVVNSPIIYIEAFNTFPLTDAIISGGPGLNWYTTATGGTGSITIPIHNTSNVGTTSYWVSSINENGCESERIEIVVIVNPIIQPPTTSWPVQIYTGDDKTIAELQVVGEAIQWYDAPNAGNLLPNTTNLVDETTYYATQTIGGVESQSRLAITVNRISDNSQLVTFPNIIGNLISDPSLGTSSGWFENDTSSTPLSNFEVLNNGTYYISQGTYSLSITTLGSGFSGPSDVAIEQDDKIIVADFQNNAVKRMNADGTNITTIFNSAPLSIAVQSDGKIVVSNYDFSIRRFNADGTNMEILLEADLISIPQVYFRSYGIAIQSDGKILFTDNQNNAVKRMNSDGSNIEVLGSGFNNPTGIAVQPDGKILVADKGNNVIKRMNSDGSNIEILGTGFNAPDKVKVQLDGKIIVSDSGNSAIKRMNTDGSNIVILSGGFNTPRGIAIEADGNIVLADYNNNQVKRITPSFYISESNRVPVQIIQDCNSTTWNGVSWSNGTPDSNKAAIFDSNYTINADIHLCKLEVNNNANVTLSSGVTLTVNNEIVVASNGNFTVENDAVILQNNPDAINSGNVVVNRNSVPMIRLDYTAWSSPVSNQNLLSFSSNTLTNRFYTYDSSGTNTATSWVSIDPSSNNFSAGVGYLIRVANNWSTVTPASYLGSFNGVPHNGTIANPVGVGYNLIGNPYPSPINADLFLTDNSSLGVNTLYFWTHVVPQNGSYTAQSNYASYNIVGGVAASAGGVIPDGVIQVGQGFFHNVSTSGNVIFNNNQRRGTSNGQFFKSSQFNIVERHRIWLSLKDDSTEYNQFLVAYMDGATNGLDTQYDGKLLTNATSTLSSIINNEDYVIQAKAFPFNDNDEVALNFVAEHDGDYTISLDNFDGLFGSQDVFLWDKSLNIYHNLKLNNYSFVSVSGSFNNRFSIVYKTNTLSNEEFENQEHVSIFMNNSNQIVIKNYGGLIDNVEVFDLTGRLLYAKSNCGNSELILENNFSTNVLLIRTKTTLNKVVTRKLIIK